MGVLVKGVAEFHVPDQLFLVDEPSHDLQQT
jgi:hypothetical protein